MVGKRYLGAKFERNGRDVFKISAPDIGDVLTAVIWHDNMGGHGAWHLQQVRSWCSISNNVRTGGTNDWILLVLWSCNQMRLALSCVLKRWMYTLV